MSRAFCSLTAVILLLATGSLVASAADVSEEILAKAISAYKAGEMEPAIGGINAAMRGRLPASLLASAHYYRGLAYRRRSEPGRAITDLTRALEYGGLSEAERSEAKENLQVAYQEAGIAPNEKVVVARASQFAEPPATSVPRTAEWPTQTIQPASVTVATGSVDVKKDRPSAAAANAAAEPWAVATAVAPSPPPVTPPKAPPPVVAAPASVQAAPAPAPKATASSAPKALAAAEQPASWRSQQVALAPLPSIPPAVKPAAKKSAAAEAPAPKPEARKPTAAEAPAPKPEAKKTEAAEKPAAKPEVKKATAAGAAGPKPEAKKTAAAEAPAPKQAAAAPQRPVQLAALAPFATEVSAAPTLPAPPAGEIRLLVGETHSRSEAFALAVRLTSQRGGTLGPRRPQIAETKFADSAVYRLRLGPFADEGQAMSLCRSLRDSGYACVTE